MLSVILHVIYLHRLDMLTKRKQAERVSKTKPDVAATVYMNLAKGMTQLCKPRQSVDDKQQIG
jgi:hypothetical protein